jgi:hypothetical protein
MKFPRFDRLVSEYPGPGNRRDIGRTDTRLWIVKGSGLESLGEYQLLVTDRGI